MYESIKSTLEFLDSFGVPRAIGSLAKKQVIYANNSFLRILGIERDEISNWTLTELIKFNVRVPDRVEVGRSFAVTIRSGTGIFDTKGYAAVGIDDLAYLVIPLITDPGTEFELGITIGKQLERQRFATYMHDHVAQTIMGTVFSVESIRGQLEYEDHPVATQLEKIVQSLTELLQAARGSFD
jgi:hypothetical protein